MTDPDATDAEVIRAALSTPEHFAVIFDRHAVGVHRYLERRLGRDGADALLGEVFRVAVERQASYDLRVSGCLPWLYGIARRGRVG